jgi:transcription termination factor Rho
MTEPTSQNTEPAQARPVRGVIDVRDKDAYIRVHGYAPSDDDIKLSGDQLRRHGLRRGDVVSGLATPNPKRRGSSGLTTLASVNGAAVRDQARRPAFADLVPLFPNERLRLETAADEPIGRVVDLVAPIGKGQRGLIVARPNTGKTTVMKTLARAVAANHPECHLMMVLIDERPEEVTEMRRAVDAEIIASTFDHTPKRHTGVAELAVERAKRLVESGQDVVMLLDSITRLARAYNLAAPGGGRVLTGGLDAGALYPPKKFLGAARNIDGAGSLTILATALVDTGSRLDEVIFEEFKGTGNMELRLDRGLADRRVYPAIDIQASGTRREDLLFTPEELRSTTVLRRALSSLDTQSAMEQLLARLRTTPSNATFLGQASTTRAAA